MKARKPLRGILGLAAACAAALAVSPASASADPYGESIFGTSGLQTFLRLSDTSGTTALDSVATTNSTYVNGVSLNQAGATLDANKAVSFDGTDDRVNLGDRYDFTGTASFSVELWIKPATVSTTQYPRVFSKEDASGLRQGWFMWLARNTNTINFSRWNNDNSDAVGSTTTLSTGTWYHVAVTYDGSNMRLYVNGTLEGTTASTRSIVNTSVNTTLGGRPDACCDWFNGAADDLAIYNRQLTGTEVASHYAASKSRGSYPDNVLGTTSLQSYWRLGESSGTSAGDSKGAVTGTYVNSPTLGATDALAMDTSSAVSFDGSNDSVNLGDNYDFSATSAFTIEAWVNPSDISTTTWRRIISKEDAGTPRRGYYMYIERNSGELSFARYDGSGNADFTGSNTVLTPNRWTHVAVTYDGSNMRVYVNGTLETTTASTRSVSNTTQNLTLGGRPDGCCDWYKGRLDEVAFYNTALSGTTLAQHVSARKKFLFGVVANETGGYDPWEWADLDEDISAAGIGLIREEFDAGDPTPDFGTWDDLWEDAAENGLMVLPQINASDIVTADVSDFADAVAAFADRYGPGGDFWVANPGLDSSLASRYLEMWNEPYYDDTSGLASSLTQLIRAGYLAGKAANPKVQFLMPAENYANGPSGFYDFVTGLYDEMPNLSDYFDAVAVHPYTKPDQEIPSCSPSSRSCFQRLTNIRSQLDAEVGGTTKNMVITEEGSSTCPSDPEWCVSENEQASRLNEVFTSLRSQFPYVDTYVRYHWRTYEADPANDQGYFGILRTNQTQKPAYTAYVNEIAKGSP